MLSFWSVGIGTADLRGMHISKGHDADIGVISGAVVC